MWKFLTTTPAQVVLWSAVLLILLVVAWYVVQRFRDPAGQDVQQPNELLTNFREMHHEGDINESEFRNIKTSLGGKLRDELSDTGDTG